MSSRDLKEGERRPRARKRDRKDNNIAKKQLLKDEATEQTESSQDDLERIRALGTQLIQSGQNFVLPYDPPPYLDPPPVYIPTADDSVFTSTDTARPDTKALRPTLPPVCCLRNMQHDGFTVQSELSAPLSVR